mmetsp:Transcript_82115/g.241077  ORF Transcript_82115/g.241077 Transcript_82115/m.241077 type:complete len:265 (-) Transcript_82115:78-872(-)
MLPCMRHSRKSCVSKAPPRRGRRGVSLSLSSLHWRAISSSGKDTRRPALAPEPRGAWARPAWGRRAAAMASAWRSSVCMLQRCRGVCGTSSSSELAAASQGPEELPPPEGWRPWDSSSEASLPACMPKAVRRSACSMLGQSTGQVTRRPGPGERGEASGSSSMKVFLMTTFWSGKSAVAFRCNAPSKTGWPEGDGWSAASAASFAATGDGSGNGWSSHARPFSGISGMVRRPRRERCAKPTSSSEASSMSMNVFFTFVAGWVAA